MMFSFTMDLGFLVLMILFTVFSLFGILWLGIRHTQRIDNESFNWETTQND